MVNVMWTIPSIDWAGTATATTTLRPEKDGTVTSYVDSRRIFPKRVVSPVRMMPTAPFARDFNDA